VYGGGCRRLGSNTATCGSQPLFKERVVSLEVLDQKMEAALRIWQSADTACQADAVRTHIMSKLREQR
jgi:hypothetical protein